MNQNTKAARFSQQWRKFASLGFLAIVVALIFTIWYTTTLDLLMSGASGALIGLGRLAGLIAAGSALLQFMLMGRIGWIEGGFGLDNIAKLHRKNGYVVIISIYIHILLVTFGYALGSMVGFVSQYVTFFNTFQDVWKAMVAAGLFTAVVGTSIYIVRKNLKFERWYMVHLLVYAAIILAFSHQLAVGGSFTASPIYSKIWTGLYLFVAANVMYYRFLSIVINYIRFGFKIERVEIETDGITSIYISGKNLQKLNAKPGQFTIIRILARKYWLQEHPFSLSKVTTNNHMRITVKNSGDYTEMIQSLKPGSKVMVAGPFGTFTSAKAISQKRLYLAGGIGITPLRSLIEEGVTKNDDAVLVWSNKTAIDEIYREELALFEAESKLRIIRFFTREKKAGFQSGRITADIISQLIPDVKERSIYICGPGKFIIELEKDLLQGGLSAEQIHTEKFSLTN
jgi:predicted ferric reductase